MIKLQILAFVLRWLASSIGMFFCISWFATVGPDSPLVGGGWLPYALAGLIFSLVNSIVKPIVKILALPLAILTMGISTVVINAVMVIFALHFLPGVEMGFTGAVFSSLILSALNYLLNLFLS